MSEPSRKLSTEEVNALMDGLKSGDLSASTITDSGIIYPIFSYYCLSIKMGISFGQK